MLEAVWVVGVVWAVGGGPGTHWQPLNRAAQRALSVAAGRESGHALAAFKDSPNTDKRVWALRARGVRGTHWQPLNTFYTPTKGSRNAGSGVGGGGGGCGVGGEGAGGGVRARIGTLAEIFSKHLGTAS